MLFQQTKQVMLLMGIIMIFLCFVQNSWMKDPKLRVVKLFLKGGGVSFLLCISLWFLHAQLKEHPERGVYVRDLSMHSVHSVGECERIMEQGWKNRAVGYTLMNKDSSRSHSIFTIHLEICNAGEHAHICRYDESFLLKSHGSNNLTLNLHVI